MGESDWERLGGDVGGARIVAAFVRAMADDFVIGFLFAGVDLARLAEREASFARAHLGSGAYVGRPLPEVHRPRRINAGQFRRRLAILRTVLRAHAVPEDVIARWIAHDCRLERVVTDGTDCAPPPDAAQG